MKGKANYNGENTKFGKALPLFIEVPFHYAKADGYIDDIITVVLDIDDWVAKGQKAAPLATHTLFRPTDKRDPLPREETISKIKVQGEGTPDEIKGALGWTVNTRTFRIYLPDKKAKEWTLSIKEILHSQRVDTKTLETTIGRLNHAGYIIPQSRYFLNKLRHLLSRCKKYGAQPVPDAVQADLLLWIQILNHTSSKGIDINNITFTKETATCIPDACEHGIGG